MRKRYVIAIRVTVLLLLASLFALAALGIRRAARLGERSKCYGNLTLLANAVWTYHHREGHLPPACLYSADGKRMHSWRTFCLAYITDGSVLNFTADKGFDGQYDFSLPWDSEVNRAAISAPFLAEAFACPGDDHAIALRRTSYVAVIGPNTLWAESRPRDVRRLGPDFEAKILFIELPASDIGWTEPRDISLDEALALFSAENGLRDSRHPEGLNYVTVGMAYRPISTIKTVEEFRDLLTIDAEDPSE